MHARGKLPDLVEEKGAAVCDLEASGPLLRSTGERALLVTEELAREQRVHQRGAADAHERTVAPLGAAMNRFGDQLLAGAALATEKHRALRGRDTIDLGEHVGDLS